ncbi:MAG TPA: ABC transporter permease, partial [Ilumatobacteraceae bacterium]|nr:ABC transporter permease [Ilumatobacteraceae bacterium]
LYLWAAFMLYFGITKNDTFISWTTFQLVFQENVFTAILALAFLVPMTTGAFDLSIGAQMSMSLVLTAYFAEHQIMPAGLGAIIGILACGIAGWISGFIVVKLKVNSFIATLGMSQVISAFIIHTSQQSINSPFSKEYMDFGAKPLFNLQRYFYMMIILAVILWFVLEHTPIGRYMFATGGNPEAARLSGVKTDRLVWGSLVVSGLIAGFAGTVYSWKVGNYDGSVGPGYLFPAVAAVFFGASQLKGRANVWGSLIAVYALAFGIWGLHLTFLNSIWIDPLFQGLSLLIAVSIASRPAVVKITKRRAEAKAAAGEPPEEPIGGPSPAPELR